jgi:hypothetical protein
VAEPTNEDSPLKRDERAERFDREHPRSTNDDASDLAEATRRRVFEIGLIIDKPTGENRVIVQWTPIGVAMPHEERIACLADLATAIGCNLAGGVDLERAACYGAGMDALNEAISNILERRDAAGANESAS